MTPGLSSHKEQEQKGRINVETKAWSRLKKNKKPQSAVINAGKRKDLALNRAHSQSFQTTSFLYRRSASEKDSTFKNTQASPVQSLVFNWPCLLKKAKEKMPNAFLVNEGSCGHEEDVTIPSNMLTGFYFEIAQLHTELRRTDLLTSTWCFSAAGDDPTYSHFPQKQFISVSHSHFLLLETCI